MDNSEMKISTGINGFGRFGMHLLRYWIQKFDSANFSIDYINDESLSLKKVEKIITYDPYLSNLKSSITFIDNLISISLTNGRQHHIIYSQCPQNKISWVGKPTIFLECTGKNTEVNKSRVFLQGKTRCVIISANSIDAEKTLLYGFNHQTYTQNDTVISYGSCTVNAYVPLANFLHAQFGIIDSDVNIIHNVPVHKFEQSNTLERRNCTLQWSALKLLPFITKENFKVTYTLVPYHGVSLIDFRFHLKNPPSLKIIMDQLTLAMEEKELKNLYRFEENDTGPEPHKFTSYSAVIIKNSLVYFGHNLYFQAYFDNENSATRYFDLVSYLSKKIEK